MPKSSVRHYTPLIFEFYILGAHSIPRSMPYPQNANARACFGLFLNVKDNPVSAGMLGVQQMAGGVAQFRRFGYYRASGRHFLERLYGGK